MKNGKDEQWLFIRGVSNDIITHHIKSKRMRSEIRAAMALARKKD
jgi:hypothetical protein